MGNPRAIVALIGPPGSGKGLVARRMTEAYGFTDVGMKLAAERMLQAGFGIDPLVYGTDARREPIESLGALSPGDLLNSLYYDWGRKAANARLWAKAWRRLVDGMPTARILLKDAAHPQDIAEVRDAGGVVIRVERPGAEPRTTGQQIQARIEADLTIKNDGRDVASLHRLVDVAMAAVERRGA